MCNGKCRVSLTGEGEKMAIVNAFRFTVRFRFATALEIVLVHVVLGEADWLTQ